MAFVRDLDNLVPIMTSNTAPSGTVTVSSEYSSGNAGWMVFNGVIQDDMWQTNATPNGWIAYEFPTPQIVNKYNIVAWNVGSGPQQAPNTWTFEGWNGSSYVTLDTRSGISSWDNSVLNSFSFTNTTAYIKYRLNVSENNGQASYMCIDVIELCAVGPNPAAPILSQIRRTPYYAYFSNGLSGGGY